ncbi:MAG: hypothetical protein IKH36_01880 [Bacilli bacterium]|nr:hypothetical protein [Bacilli bacterium]
MEKMVYETLLNKDRKVLENGLYNGYKFWIISYGSHPCAYVELENTHPYYGKCNCDAYDLDIEVHGGITYGDYGLGSTISDKHFIFGWDYNHYNDYNYNDEKYGLASGKKWTTEEIFEDVKNVINQLKEAEIKHGKIQ